MTFTTYKKGAFLNSSNWTGANTWLLTQANMVLTRVCINKRSGSFSLGPSTLHLAYHLYKKGLLFQ
jgi:hypothetical protein